MSIYPFRIANNTEGDADELMELLDIIDGILDGGIGPEHLADDFVLDYLKLSRNRVEVNVTLRFQLNGALTAGIKSIFGIKPPDDYVVQSAFVNYALSGGGAPGGSPNRVTFSILQGAYVANVWTPAASQVVGTRTIYAATPENASQDITASIVDFDLTGPTSLALSVDGVPVANPPTAGFIEVVVTLTRSLRLV